MHETIRKHLVSCNFKKRCLSIWLFAFSGLTLCRSSLNILLQTLTDRRLFLLFLCVPTTHLCQKEIDTPWVRFVYQTTENITGLIGRRSVEILMCIGKLLSFQRANSQSCFSQKKPFWHALACNAGASVGALCRVRRRKSCRVRRLKSCRVQRLQSFAKQVFELVKLKVAKKFSKRKKFLAPCTHKK